MYTIEQIEDRARKQLRTLTTNAEAQVFGAVEKASQDHEVIYTCIQGIMDKRGNFANTHCMYLEDYLDPVIDKIESYGLFDDGDSGFSAGMKSRAFIMLMWFKHYPDFEKAQEFWWSNESEAT